MAGTIREGKKTYPSVSQGLFKKWYNENWGVYLMSCKDPEGVVTEEDIRNIRIHEDFPKIPKELWSAWISLCFYMCPKGGYYTDSRYHDKQLEVGAYFLRKRNDKSQWKIVVPRQRVSGASVNANLNDCIDIVTGERYTQFPPKGWHHAGSTHSHNKMGAFYSGTDNKSELNNTGLHIVVGKIDHEAKKYTHISSVTVHGVRKYCKLRDVVDVTPTKQAFHRSVLNYINEVVATYSYRPSKGYGGPRYSSYRKGSTSSKDYDWRDYREGKLFDYSKDPDFVRGLDHTNSDLFDEDGHYDGYGDDLLDDISNLVADLVSAGKYTVDDVINMIENNREIYEEDENAIIRMISSDRDVPDDDYGLDVEDNYTGSGINHLFEESEPDGFESMADVNNFDRDGNEW